MSDVDPTLRSSKDAAELDPAVANETLPESPRADAAASTGVASPSDLPETATPAGATAATASVGATAVDTPADIEDGEPETIEPVPTEPVEAYVRQRANIMVFIVFGAFLGVVAAILLTYAFPISTETVEGFTAQTYTTGQVLGFLVVFLAPVGAGLGAVIALILDAIVSRKARHVMIEPEAR